MGHSIQACAPLKDKLFQTSWSQENVTLGMQRKAWNKDLPKGEWLWALLIQLRPTYTSQSLPEIPSKEEGLPNGSKKTT